MGSNGGHDNLGEVVFDETEGSEAAKWRCAFSHRPDVYVPTCIE